MTKVLWLASWYPNAANPFSGDFIRRQAEAVSIFQPLKIVFAGKSPLNPVKNISNAVTELPNLEEYLLYYDSSNRENIFSEFRSVVSYFRIHLAWIRQMRKIGELPELVHVHVAMKAGLIALYLKWKYHIPYLLTEHWTGYYRESSDNLFKKSWLIRFLTRRIIKNAKSLFPVSEALGIQINRYWVSRPFHKIPNVVNTKYFFYSPSKTKELFRFIHISTMIHQKNPEGIIRSFLKLLTQGYDAELMLIGPIPESLSKFMQASEIPQGKILHTGEIPYEQVALELRNASALVLFSFYENLPCVVLEAICSGIPVIASKVGGIEEVINEENGILVSNGDEKELREAMKTMILNARYYHAEKISKQAAQLFSYPVVGKKIATIYNDTSNNK
jgi:glycosyltransferase involved in cell wall biosynthesis